MMGKGHLGPKVILLIGLSCLWTIELCNADDLSLSFYAGKMTTEVWEETVSTSTKYTDVGIAVIAGAWTFKRYYQGALSFELEAQVGKYFGDQDNWEFNLPLLTLRWSRFPWQRHVKTTFAWGIGPSYATKVPEVEVAINGKSEQWMVYWFGELTFGPPDGKWALLFRLHHRSEAYGIVADEGGSNTLAAGLKFYF